jgi:hypothetical protein
MEHLRESFKNYFNQTGIELPQHIPAQGQLNGGGWLVKFIYLQDESGQFYLDCFAENRQTNSRHFRILSTGEIIYLENLQENLIFNQETGDDWAKARTMMDNHNQKVQKILQSKGFWE